VASVPRLRALAQSLEFAAHFRPQPPRPGSTSAHAFGHCLVGPNGRTYLPPPRADSDRATQPNQLTSPRNPAGFRPFATGGSGINTQAPAALFPPHIAHPLDHEVYTAVEPVVAGLTGRERFRRHFRIRVNAAPGLLRLGGRGFTESPWSFGYLHSGKEPLGGRRFPAGLVVLPWNRALPWPELPVSRPLVKMQLITFRSSPHQKSSH
jgi:hypothetical protein